MNNLNNSKGNKSLHLVFILLISGGLQKNERIVSRVLSGPVPGYLKKAKKSKQINNSNHLNILKKSGGLQKIQIKKYK